MSAQQDIKDRKLATAVASLNPKRVAKALKEGGDPSAYSVKRFKFPLEIVADIWGAAYEDETRKLKAGTIIDMLLEAGADPLSYYKGESPVFSHGVSSHPHCIRRALEAFPEHARTIADLDHNPELNRWGTAYHLLNRWGTAYYLRRIATDKPFYRAIRDHLLQADIPSETWWRAALEARTPDLMTYVLDDRQQAIIGTPTIEWVSRSVDNFPSGVIQDASGILVWIESLSPKEQEEALLGRKGKEGILAAIIENIDSVRNNIWGFALSQSHIVEAIKEQGMLKGFLALSMLGDAKHAQQLLKMALREGIDVSAVSIQDARQVKKKILQWDEPHGRTLKPDAHATLISGHLKRRTLNASVALMRALVKAGVKPDYGDLCDLCRVMSYSAGGKRYLSLFDDWTIKHKVDPSPEGSIPAWDHAVIAGQKIPSKERFRHFLEARYAERMMLENIPEPTETPVLRARPKGARL